MGGPERGRRGGGSSIWERGVEIGRRLQRKKGFVGVVGHSFPSRGRKMSAPHASMNDANILQAQ